VDAQRRCRCSHSGGARRTQPASRSSLVDLLIAAIAEVNGATLLHCDRHFDAIEQVTGQPMEWLARRGTLA
jgi:predicted nucleic acid-binding protein